jgi:hypothetical protein
VGLWVGTEVVEEHTASIFSKYRFMCVVVGSACNTAIAPRAAHHGMHMATVHGLLTECTNILALKRGGIDVSND